VSWRALAYKEYVDQVPAMALRRPNISAQLNYTADHLTHGEGLDVLLLAGLRRFAGEIAAFA
jgi:hypothetical protein